MILLLSRSGARAAAVVGGNDEVDETCRTERLPELGNAPPAQAEEFLFGEDQPAAPPMLVGEKRDRRLARSVGFEATLLQGEQVFAYLPASLPIRRVDEG